MRKLPVCVVVLTATDDFLRNRQYSSIDIFSEEA